MDENSIFSKLSKIKKRFTMEDNKEVKDQETLQEELDQTTQEVEQDLPQKEEPLDEVVLLKEQVAALKDKYLRLTADFDTYRRRVAKEKIDNKVNAAKDIMADLINVVDDFDRAKAIAEDESNDEVFSEGVSLVYKKLNRILEERGLKVMDSTGLQFDSDYHEAITEIPAPTEELKGKNIDTVTKGYFLNESILRHAKVVVGK